MKKLFTLITCIYLSSFAVAQLTWNTSMDVAASMYGNNHPRIVSNAAGDPVIIWNHSANVMFTRWNGSGFTMPVAVNPAFMTVAGADWMGPDIASKGDTLYIVFKVAPEADTASHIFLVRSFDGGMTFSNPFQVDNIADSISRFPTMSIDDDGQPIVAFMKFDNSFMDSRWVLTRSNDFGSTFITDFKASGWNSSAAVCDCCPGAVTNSGDTVMMLYRDNNNNIRDMWAGMSVDNGNSISSGIPVDQNNWMIMSCSASGPDGVIVGDSLYTVYMSGANGNTRVYFSATEINSSGSNGNPITGNFGGLSTQNYPRIAADGNAIGMAWTQTVNNVEQAALLFTSDNAYGFPQSYDTVDLGNVTCVDLAISNGNVYVVWEDDNTGTVKFRSGAYDMFTGANNIHKNSVVVSPTVTNNSINIRGVQTNDKLSITDATGRIVIEQKVKQESMQLSLLQLQSGIYFLSIECGNKKTFTSKIIKY
jgi:hypothetical protein